MRKSWREREGRSNLWEINFIKPNLLVIYLIHFISSVRSVLHILQITVSTVINLPYFPLSFQRQSVFHKLLNSLSLTHTPHIIYTCYKLESKQGYGFLMHILIAMSTLDNAPPAPYLTCFPHTHCTFAAPPGLIRQTRGDSPRICFFMSLDISSQC